MVTAWVPDWPVVAAGVPVTEPVAVLRANRVTARTAAAGAMGVVIGQRRRQALSHCPDLELLDTDAFRDAREFEPIVQVAAVLAPRVEVVEPGWITVASRGPSRYFGGDDAFADRLAGDVRAVLQDGVVVGVGVADGRFPSGIAARRSSRSGVPEIVDPGTSPAYCAPLGVGWLHTLGETDPEMVDLFSRLGVRTLGELAAFPVSDVLGRFGPRGAHVHRLAGGSDVRLQAGTDPPRERRLDRILDDPPEQSEAVVFVAKQLADELAGSLADRGMICVRLVVAMETENGERSERTWYRSSGLTSAAMVERVRWQLDGWVGGGQGITAGVALVRLCPDEVRADTGEQLGLWGGESDADRRASRAIARLTTVATEANVTVPVWCGGRLPADRYRWVPATTVDLGRRSADVGDDPVSADGPWPGSLPQPSPASVHDEPREIEVLDSNGAAVAVGGRGAVSAAPSMLRDRGIVHAVTGWAGPWPVEEAWWDPGRRRRVARFQVTVEDGRAFLVFAEYRRWWIGATYD